MAAQENSPIEHQQESEAQEYGHFIDEVEAQYPEDLKILNRLKPLQGCKVVDLGCGTGHYTYRLAERVGENGRVIGVDPDRERIKIASEKWARENLSFVVRDGESYPEDQYDLIFSHYALHCVKDQRAIFENAYKNLRPGGQFAFVVGHSISTIGDEMSALMGPEGHQAIINQWHFISAEKYREIATSVGFKVVMIEEDIDSFTFSSVDVLLASWYGITNSLFNTSKVNQTELGKFKKKYAGKKLELKSPVIRTIFDKM